MRSHFVPKWYLKKFTDTASGFLHIYDKINEMWRKQKPEKVMRIKNYYKQNWAPKGIDKNILENIYSNIEGHAKDAFSKLISNPKTLVIKDFLFMLHYIELQRIRVPKQDRIAKELLKTELIFDAINNNDVSLVPQLLSGNIKIKDSCRFDFMKMATGTISPYLTRMIWEIISAPDGYSFVTSDNPILFLNRDFPPPRNFPPLQEPLVAQIGTIVIFALSPKHLLHLRHPENVKDMKLSHSTLLEDVKMESGFIKGNHRKGWTKEMAIKQNGMMLRLSDTIIVANNKEVLEDALRHELKGNK